MASISSLHNRRAITGTIDWPAIASLYDQLLLRRPTVGVAIARAAAYMETAAIDIAADGLAAVDPSLVQHYQPYWTVLADLADQMGDILGRTAARGRAMELTSDPATLTFLQQRWAGESVRRRQ
jgi:RNA polymerase sigma-70 factor (ECF subfamily)